ncbi:TPA_asm: MC111R [Molluscum contagiosum virus]|uniref:Intermediate transcription factor 3 small subunit n=2 Tax=Molluscum contagiosum virus TaxID=10279 RepID=A0A7G5AXB2_MCV1|nr:MC111 [Molluscum contagiosum virus subtype 1]AZT86238.1 MC111R [Molluscum contagiosum virus]AYO88430.1 MC111 [Molluscum contagiosum virus subtype 1]AYO88606.1 MC111 [Molluscum contagiosum virus subtype 1]AYO88960.1 MC111 [Molluscum contagiosum virus subtype 1]
MFQRVPDLEVDAVLELGDFCIQDTRGAPRESAHYVARHRRLFVNRSKDDERKLALGFFLPRLPFLTGREIHHLFQCVDTVKHVHITKKNNVIVAPYVILITMAARGYRLTETLLEMFFPELHKESSKKFRFATQIQIIQEKLGYAPGGYYVYEFECYYATVGLLLQSYHGERDPGELFDARRVSSLVKALAEITYRLYCIHLRSQSVQWSISASTLINQIVNTVLLTLQTLQARALACGEVLTCTLARDSGFPSQQLAHYADALALLVADMRRVQSCKTNRHDQQVLLSFCRVGGREPALAPEARAAPVSVSASMFAARDLRARQRTRTRARAQRARLADANVPPAGRPGAALPAGTPGVLASPSALAPRDGAPRAPTWQGQRTAAVARADEPPAIALPVLAPPASEHPQTLPALAAPNTLSGKEACKCRAKRRA